MRNIITIMMIPAQLPEKAQAIASAAIEAIHDKGLDRVKLTDVARRAGVTTGAVTYYFEDKDALLVAAFQETWRRMFTAISAYEGGWEIDRFLNTLPTTDASRKGWSVWLAFCGRAQTSAEMNGIYREYYAHLEELLLESILPHHPVCTATDIRTAIAALDGIGLCATLHPDLWPPERQHDCLRDLLMNLFPNQS